jgi:class 3 adenylate cyclase
MENDALPKDAQPIERRLATILMADVADYSRMMGENEERTVQVFRGHRQVFDELLRLHRGRIFNTAGDAVLAEFSSAVEAVRCATEIQAALHTRNEHLPAEQRMLFRIGINLGDVIVQGGDLLGDGVNVAARIQSIAEPGGICISGSVYDQIQNKLTLQFKQLGEQSFKNIARPVRTFSISDDRDGTSRSASLPRKGRIVATIGALIALIASVGVASWFYRDYSQRAADEARRATEAQRVAEVQRKAEQDKSAAATAQNEAKLRSELQAAKDALTQAEASKRKTEQDRTAAEAAQREARLQAELRSVKDAQQRADASEKKADAERKAAAEALRVAAAEATAAKAAVDAAAAKAAAAAPQKAAAPPAVAGLVPSKPGGASAAGLDRFDGIYNGRLCHMFVQPEPKTVCWPAALKVERGALLSTWVSGNTGKPAYARGKISPEGTVEITLEGFNPKGDPAAGIMTGTWSDNEISASGAWNRGLRVNARWTRAQ